VSFSPGSAVELRSTGQPGGCPYMSVFSANIRS
jgi:hypothetical protein